MNNRKHRSNKRFPTDISYQPKKRIRKGLIHIPYDIKHEMYLTDAWSRDDERTIWQLMTKCDIITALSKQCPGRVFNHNQSKLSLLRVWRKFGTPRLYDLFKQRKKDERENFHHRYQESRRRHRFSKNQSK